MRKRNLRLGLVMLSIVVVFFMGVVLKQVLLR